MSRRQSPSTRARRAVARAQACPECGAVAGEHCIGKSGRGRLAPHRARFIGVSMPRAVPALRIVSAQDIAKAVNVEKERELLTLSAETFATATEERFLWMAEHCQSPIERLMLLALYTDSQASYPFRLEVWRGKDLRALKEYPIWEQLGCWLVVQPEIGPYRADLVIVNNLIAPRQIIIVECDGHDFHERTKEQAAHDKRRDRYFAAEGFTTLHFPGSEIYRSPRECAEEALAHVRPW